MHGSLAKQAPPRRAGSGTPVTHVLQPFAKAEREVVAVAVQEACDVIRMVLRDGVLVALNKGGTRASGAKAPKAEGKQARPAGAAKAKAPPAAAGGTAVEGATTPASAL